MAEALGLRVAVVILEVLVLLGTVVPREFEQALIVARELVLGEAPLARVAQEVQVELGGGLLDGAEQLHAEHLLVELERLLGVLDPDHRVVLRPTPSSLAHLIAPHAFRLGHGIMEGKKVGPYHPVRLRIRHLPLLRRIIRALRVLPLANDFHPVPIRVQRERDVLHASVRELLLEPVPRVLDPLARGLDVVHGDAHVPEPAMRLRVAVVDLVVGVVLGAVVVRQLDEALPVERAVALRLRARPVVPQEVQVEFGIGELQLLEHAHAEEFVELDCVAMVSATSW